VTLLQRLFGPSKLTRDDFAREIERRLQITGHVVQLDVDSLAIAVDGAPPVDLLPKWQSYERAPRAERQRSLVAAVGSFCLLDSFWVATWLEVKTTDTSAVADALSLANGEPQRFTDAFSNVSQTRAAVVTHGDWTFVFTAPYSDVASRNVEQLSRRFGEAHVVLMEEKHGALHASLYRDGACLRLIEMDAGQGPIPLKQNGAPIPGEPALTDEVKSWEALAFAISSAWGATAEALLQTQPMATSAQTHESS
jgi:hypothetical protein